MRKRRLQRFTEQESDEGSSINLTPLIDVVFVVLIIFILIAPMLELDRVELAHASPNQKKEMAVVQENSPISIHVHADNTVWFNSKKVTLEELLPLLIEAKKLNPHRVPQLFHDKKAFFGTYQSIKNALEVAGFEQLDVILQPT